MGKPHKHAELIKSWADGAEIEFKFRGGKIERQPQKNYVATSWMVGL